MTYRIFTPFFSERALQRIHYLLVTVVVILGSIGIHAAIVKTNKKPHHLHVGLGWLAVASFFLQSLFGGGAISFVRRNPNHGLVKLHRVVGPWIHVAVAIVLMDGILMKCHSIWCVLLALSVALTTLCTALALVKSEPPQYIM